MHKPRKLALAVLASITIAGIAGASASSLGGLSGGSVGSDDTIVASCQTSGQIGVSYGTTYNAALSRYDITSVNLSNVNSACGTLSASVTLADGTGLSLTANTAAVPAGGGSFSVPVSGASAQLVEKLSLVIQG